MRQPLKQIRLNRIQRRHTLLKHPGSPPTQRFHKTIISVGDPSAVVQSAVFTSVSKLEKELRVDLFDRTRQQIRLTPAGEQFHNHGIHVPDRALR